MNKRTIYVGNLPFDTNKNELAALVMPRRIERHTIIYDKETGKSKGFGFVQFATPAMAMDAVQQLDGTQFKGRTLKVSIARERDSQ